MLIFFFHGFGVLIHGAGVSRPAVDMDDSSYFMQWAMDTLHQHPSATAAAAYTDGGDGGDFSSLQGVQALRDAGSQTAADSFQDLTVQVDHRANSWSSSDSPGAGAAASGWSLSPHAARASTGGGGGSSSAMGNRPMSWNFSAASAQPTEDSGSGGVPAALELARAAPPASASPAAGKKGGSSGSGPAAASSGYVQDHIIAERRRREKINQRFIELSTVIPGLKKMDKATILGDALKYVRELHEKVKTLEDDAGGRSAVVLVRHPCVHQSSSGDGGEGSTTTRLPEIEARLSEKSVLLRIHCGSAKGMLVRVLAEVEDLRLAITHTSVMPFPASTVIITITAKACNNAMQLNYTYSLITMD
ncbi:hypothetical protein GUJ93_ZPchr0012g19292 [Zizania palustris]|uniref:BHLH domain-containing protein n=1 Tax=Zizania palustris TaxID=103762 RepID=A0A8J5WN34_ZIZPA|nr:hypothetical protein GUJ93_ZPchr0012g19292 [Zizania palustris]